MDNTNLIPALVKSLMVMIMVRIIEQHIDFSFLMFFLDILLLCGLGESNYFPHFIFQLV